MNIALLGASGHVGRQLCAELLKRGHTVTAFVHSNTQALSESPRLHIVVGDVRDAQDVKKAIQNTDVVISTLGSWGTPTKDIVSTATKHLLPLLGARRYISVTGAGARLPNEKLSTSGIVNRLFLQIIAQPVLHDADEHLRLLTSSHCSWTAFRAPVMTSKKRNTYTLRTYSPAPWQTVPRAAVVQALADSVEKNTSPRSAPYITS